MALSLQDRWVWDFWIAQDGNQTHLFYLCAPKSLVASELRHWNVTIGHARSTNFRGWEVLPDVLWPANAPAWDDYTTWSGSVIKSDQNRWLMFYTGTSRAEDGLVQRIGLAESEDLFTWTRYGSQALLSADADHYEQLDTQVWREQAFRDPWVFPDPDGDGWHMFFTARETVGATGRRGVIGHAVSEDLYSWSQRPPIFRSHRYGHLEVPQPIEYRGTWYCLFCVAHADIDSDYAQAQMTGTQGGIHYLVADTVLGPWHLVDEDFLAPDSSYGLYAGKLVIDVNGELSLMAFRNRNAEGVFVGEIIDPIPLRVFEDGRLMLMESSYPGF